MTTAEHLTTAARAAATANEALRLALNHSGAVTGISIMRLIEQAAALESAAAMLADAVSADAATAGQEVAS